LASKMLRVLFIMLFCHVGLCFADAEGAGSQNFDTDAATKWLDGFQSKFNENESDVAHLKEAIDALDGWQRGAKRCVDAADTAIANIQEAATAATPAPLAIEANTPITPSLAPKAADAKVPDSADKTYLENKIAGINDSKSKCKIILLRTQELLDNYRANLDQQARLELLSGGPQIWVTKLNLYDLTQLPNLFLTTKFPWANYLGLSALSGWTKALYPITGIIGFCLGLFIWWRLKRKIQTVNTSTATGKMWQAFLAVCLRYVLPIATVAGPLSVLAFLWFTQNQASIFALFVASVMGYFLLAACADFIFYPPAPAVNFNKVPGDIGKRIRRNIRWLGLWILIAANLYVIHHEYRLNFTTLFIFSLVSMSIIAFNLLLLTHHVRRLLEQKAPLKWIHRLLGKMLQLGLLAVVIASCMAYQHLAFYLMKGIILTLAGIAVFWLAFSFLHAIFPGAGEVKPNWQRLLRYRLGLSPDENMIEFMVVKFAFYLVFIMAGLMLLSAIWGFSDSVRLALREALWQGFSLGSFAIIPVRLVVGLLSFGLLILATRICSHLILKEATQLERGAREAYAAMVNYIGWGIALLCALNLAGVNLAGLAIVAGALSVGIGFGLQNIVNNFVSGIILLIERPIKIGDRVSVGDTEGVVKKISIRSTQISTNAQADVVVPNSDLITRQVTNYMFRDQRARLLVTLYVSYGAEVSKITEVLLQVAKDHPEVSHKEGEDPVVLLSKLGEQAMVFELYFTIRDVNRKGAVRSDINMNIEKAFRAAGLSLASPPMQIKLLKDE